MKSSKTSIPLGNPSFNCIDRLFSSRMLTFFSSEYIRVTRLFQAARTINTPSCCFFSFSALIRHNKFRNSFQSEIRFAESHTAAAYGFLLPSFFRMQGAESCSEGASTRIYADRYRCGGKDAETLRSSNDFR